MKSWPKSKLGQVGVGSNIAQNHSSSPQEGISGHIICPNSYEKLIKGEIRLSWSQFEHCSKSLIQPLGNHIWSLFASMHMKSSPKSKLGKVGVGSNILQNHSAIIMVNLNFHVYVNSLNSGKAADIFGLKAEHLKKAGRVISTFLADLFNAVLDTRSSLSMKLIFTHTSERKGSPLNGQL